jgi:Carbohydrate-binding family 9
VSDAEIDPAHYTCLRTRAPLPVDADLSKSPWRKAIRSPRFVDMVIGNPGYFDTRAAALWDDQALCIAFWIEEPFVEAALTKRDSLVFNENDVELFIDGGDCYYEFEINALGTVYEVLFVWKDAYRRGGRIIVSAKGQRIRAFLDWDFPGMRSAVQVDGRINDRSVVDKGWFAEISLPWAGMQWLANGRPLPPKNGDVWRMFFGRFEKLTPGGVEVQPHPAWCWSPHCVYDTHLPERWTYVHFSDSYI